MKHHPPPPPVNQRLFQSKLRVDVVNVETKVNLLTASMFISTVEVQCYITRESHSNWQSVLSGLQN